MYVHVGSLRHYRGWSYWRRLLHIACKKNIYTRSNHIVRPEHEQFFPSVLARVDRDPVSSFIRIGIFYIISIYLSLDLIFFLVPGSFVPILTAPPVSFSNLSTTKPLNPTPSTSTLNDEESHIFAPPHNNPSGNNSQSRSKLRKRGLQNYLVLRDYPHRRKL